MSQCFQIQNQKMGPWKMSMQNISYASRVYNNIKNCFFSEIKLYVITVIVAYKCSIISDYVLLLIIVIFLLLN